MTTLNAVMTIAEIAQVYNRRPGTIRQYIDRNQSDMEQRGVIRKSGKVWLMLSTEAARIWSNK